MFERFTAAARQVVVGAQEEARDLGHDHIGTEDVLLSMLADADGAVARLLRPFDYEAAREAIGPLKPDLSFTEADDEDTAALKAIGIDLDKVRAAIEESFGAGALKLPKPAPKKRGIFGKFYAGSGHIPFSPRAKKVLELSLREAIRLHQNFIAPEHLMLGLLREGQGLAARVLADHDVDFRKLRADLENSLKNEAA
ncbi:Clp protease N-terminal domain-containing protein [Actinoplanes sp. CA-142083]|uniref:Clp protease N-terminal domain-containing protein n=1 Tax=Actinoplanes sp. CA-142083 TaxID=3239903 RepID=UPI003D8C7BEA